MISLDEDALIAAVDLVGRSGAKQLEIGYLREDVPVEDAQWWAHARYRGARIGSEHHRGPIEAVEALARRLLTGDKCKPCGRLVALSDAGAVAYEGATMVDGSRWTVEQAAKAGQCRWRREGARWVRGCKAGS